MEVSSTVGAMVTRWSDDRTDDDPSVASDMVTRPGRIAKWWLDRPLRSKGLAVLATPVLVLVVTVAASFIALSYQVAVVGHHLGGGMVAACHGKAATGAERSQQGPHLAHEGSHGHRAEVRTDGLRCVRRQTTFLDDPLHVIAPLQNLLDRVCVLVTELGPLHQLTETHDRRERGP